MARKDLKRKIMLVTLLVAVVLLLYFYLSPYQQCMRDLKPHINVRASVCAESTVW